MEKFENLKVWQLSHKLAVDIYKETEEFPEIEKYGLISQIRRAAISVPTNIVEGSSRKSKKEFLRFLDIALGSCGEVTYHLILARDLSMLKSKTHEELRNGYQEISRMLNGLMTKLRSSL